MICIIYTCICHKEKSEYDAPVTVYKDLEKCLNFKAKIVFFSLLFNNSLCLKKIISKIKMLI